MRKLLLLLSLILVSSTLVAQKDKHTLSFDGIDAIKLSMTKAELEKLLNKKITLKHIGIDERYTETVYGTYNGIKFEIGLLRSEEHGAIIENVCTTSPLYKTPEGIGVGSDRLTIINAYEKHLLIITRDEITLADINDIRSSIVFFMKNNKVVKIGVEPTAAFRDRE